MSALRPGGLIGIGRVGRGLTISDKGTGESRASFGLVTPIPEIDIADIEIIPIAPLDGAVDVGRADRFRLLIRDGNLPLETSTIRVRYRQVPFPAESADGWVTMLLGTAFQPGFDGTGSSLTVGPFEDGEQAAIHIQPLFGLLPGSTGYIEARIEDAFANVATLTWSFTVRDDAVSANMREEFYKFRRQSERYGWDPLIVARQTYDFNVDPAVTGADLEIDVNESLVADFADQLSESPFDLPILNNVRRYRLLGKPIEYARDSADPQGASFFSGYISGVPTPVTADRKLPETQQHVTYTDTDLLERRFRYYALFVLVPPRADSPDWFWAYADNSTFAHAFAYGRYGHGQKLYDNVPEAWQVIDGELP